MSANSLEETLASISYTNVLIYAPPAYGKTTYITNRKHQLDFVVFDTDDCDVPPGSGVEGLVTNYWQLLERLEYGLAICFFPPEDQFKSGCEFRGLEYKSSWYSDVAAAIDRASSTRNVVVITSGHPILSYERFIMRCFRAVQESASIPAVPIVQASPPQPKNTNIILVDDWQKVTHIREPITAGSQLMYLACDSNPVEPEKTEVPTTPTTLAEDSALLDAPLDEEVSSILSVESINCIIQDLLEMKLPANSELDRVVCKRPFYDELHYENFTILMTSGLCSIKNDFSCAYVSRPMALAFVAFDRIHGWIGCRRCLRQRVAHHRKTIRQKEFRSKT